MVLQWNTRRLPSMSVHKQSVSFTDAAFAFARELVEAGEYPNVSAAVSGEMARAKVGRERERMLLEAEVRRRLALPPDQWDPVAPLAALTAGAREHLASLRSTQKTGSSKS
jgi:antitoxin ParD1/3/4